MKERRLYKRHTARLPSRIEPITTLGTEKIYHLETKDISIGGAFIYIKDSSYFPQGTRFIMDVNSEGIAIQCIDESEIMNIRGS